MIKYTTLSALLPYIPQPLLQDVDTLQIQSWAYQAFREFSLPFTEDYDVALLSIISHKAALPPDLKRIVEVRLLDRPPAADIIIDSREIRQDKLLIYQQILFSNPVYQFSRRVRYLGQMRTELIDEELYCSDCLIGFSVDAMMTCLTIDVPDGDIIIVYTRPPRQGDEVLIPDHPLLMQGLSAWVQAMYWRDRTYSHEQNSQLMYQDNWMKATNFLKAFKASRTLSSVNPDKHRALISRRNPKPYR